MTAVPDLADPILSEEQRAAVESDSTALVVVASAGSGKTEVVARRVQRLLEQDESARVLCLTYTVKAADELKARLNSRLGAMSHNVESDTIHGFSHSLLRAYGTRVGLPVEPEVITRDEDRTELLNAWLEAQGQVAPVDLRGTFARLDLARATGTETDLLADWEAALATAGALDYPALLNAALSLLEIASVRRQVRRQYVAVVVDEAQNLTPAQYDLLLALVSDGTSVAIPTMLVGDDKQSIVSFAGASPRFLGAFAERFEATRVDLTTNFRSAGAIARAASAIAQHLGQRAPENASYAAPGLIEKEACDSEEDEAAHVADWAVGLLTDGLPAHALAPGEPTAVDAEDIAVLARSGAGLQKVAEALTSRGIDYAISTAPRDWLSSTPGRLVAELLALRSAPSHRSTYWEISRLLDLPIGSLSSVDQVRSALTESSCAGVSALAPLLDLENVDALLSTVEAIHLPQDVDDSEAANWQADLAQLARAWREFDSTVSRADLTWAGFKLHCSRAQRGDDLTPGIRLLTVHKAQGREYSAVAVIGLNNGQFPDFRARTDEERDSELRTFYVAVTRARRALLVTRARYRQTRYGTRQTEPSPYARLLT